MLMSFTKMVINFCPTVVESLPNIFMRFLLNNFGIGVNQKRDTKYIF